MPLLWLQTSSMMQKQTKCGTECDQKMNSSTRDFDTHDWKEERRRALSDVNTNHVGTKRPNKQLDPFFSLRGPGTTLAS
jgi:hypothetical protein